MQFLHCTFVSVSKSPRIDVTIIRPTRKNDTCWLQKATSISKPHQCTAISSPLVTGSFFPTRSKTMFIVQIKIFHRQYKLKKWPSTLKYLPWSVRAQRCRSCIFRISCTSRNSCLESSSSAEISNRNWPISKKQKYIYWLNILTEFIVLTLSTGWSMRYAADHTP